MDRRQFIASSATAAGALLLGNALGAVSPAFAATGSALGPTDHWGTPRASKLREGVRLAHGDMHNHTLFSDGDGDAANAFRLMRERNLDIACITDHTNGETKLPSSACGSCDAISMGEEEWQQLKAFADEQDDPENGFVAIRGFEWSASVPQTGHMNVWFTETWTDPAATAHAGSAGGSQFIGQGLADEVGGNSPVAGELFGEAGHALARQGAAVERGNPLNFGAMAGMYDWLLADPSRPVLGGGRDGIAGFNHPGREAGRFGQFAFDAAVIDRVVSIEVFNRREDYLFEGIEVGQPSPIVQCLNNGWKVGLNGVTDEHGDDAWGEPRDKGRMGLWVARFDRDGIREAMQARRFFATNRRGFRLDVMAEDGAGARGFMGEDLTISGDRLTFTLDIDGNDVEGIDDYRGRTLNVQVCAQGDVLPTVLRTVPVVVPGPDAPPVTIADVDLDGTPYVFLRLCDPARGDDGRTREAVAADFAGVGGAIAYSSPFYLARA